MINNHALDRRLFLRRLALLAGSLTIAGLSGCDRAESVKPQHAMPAEKYPKSGQNSKKPPDKN